MSELNNPLFENQKEFLERQKQEYKNALLSNVSEIKNQSQKVGKTLAIAGGALAGIWVVSSLFRNKKKTKTPKGLKAAPAYKALPVTTTTTDELVQKDGSINYEDALHAAAANPTPGYYHTSSKQEPSVVQEAAKSFFQSDMAKALSQQVTAFLLIYVTKKLEEYLQVAKNTDIATSTEPEVKDIDFSYHEENVVK